jgi:hypothetical protein
MTRKHSTTQTKERPTYEPSFWKGSEHTAAMVAAQIEERWGEEEAEKYDPETNCFTFQTWKLKGFSVKKGEHGLLSSTIITKKGEEDSGDGGKPTTYPKRVWLFYYLQVEPTAEREKRKASLGEQAGAEYIKEVTLGSDEEGEEGDTDE